MLPKNQLSHEFGRSLGLDMLQDVNLLGQVFDSFFISFVPEVSLLPPKTVLFYTTAEATAKDPSTIVL